MTESYLERRSYRMMLSQLMEEIIFGYVISFILILLGYWHYFFTLNANDAMWKIVILVGVTCLLLTVVIPSVWNIPVKISGTILRYIGSKIFSLMLVLVYYLMIFPAGLVYRHTKGCHPIYQWHDESKNNMEGWVNKELLIEAEIADKKNHGLFARFFYVINFFMARGNYIFIPTLLLLVALGMTLFFVKSSALAPFIYTLF